MKTDSQLQQDVSAELAWEPSVHAAQIGVEVKDGVVTLCGEVGSCVEKWHAERAVQRVAGVQALAVELSVKLSGSDQRSDADIARSVENVLCWTSLLPTDAVKVQVEGGWVTLSGEVDWPYQRLAAADAVRCLMGVTGVSDQIAVKPQVVAGSVKADIEAALRRRAMSEAQSIAVAVQGADVTLTGTVHSWAERALATHTAWSTPGVRHVLDKMTLAF